MEIITHTSWVFPFYCAINYIARPRKFGERSLQHVQLNHPMIDGELRTNFGSLLLFNKIVVHYCTRIYYAFTLSRETVTNFMRVVLFSWFIVPQIWYHVVSINNRLHEIRCTLLLIEPQRLQRYSCTNRMLGLI